MSNKKITPTGKNSLREFAGALSEESAERLEKAIKEIRRAHTISHEKRIKKIIEALEKDNDCS